MRETIDELIKQMECIQDGTSEYFKYDYEQYSIESAVDFIRQINNQLMEWMELLEDVANG